MMFHMAIGHSHDASHDDHGYDGPHSSIHDVVNDIHDAHDHSHDVHVHSRDAHDDHSHDAPHDIHDGHNVLPHRPTHRSRYYESLLLLDLIDYP